MSGGADFPQDRDEILSLRRGHLRYFPVVPGRIEFAAALRQALLDERPDVVAVELPGWLKPLYMEAVDRLPEMSVVMVSTASRPLSA